jgi:hypothetical protein
VPDGIRLQRKERRATMMNKSNDPVEPGRKRGRKKHRKSRR